jgi:hypothetical protein
MSFYASALGLLAGCALEVGRLALANCRRMERVRAGPGARFDRTSLKGSSAAELCYDGAIGEAMGVSGSVLESLKARVMVKGNDGFHTRGPDAGVAGMHALSSLTEAPFLPMDAQVIDLSGIDDLSEWGLKGSRSLAAVILSKRVTALPVGFFFDCFRLASVNIAECRALVRLGRWCFAYCASLRRLGLPSSLEIIEASAFYESALDCVMLDDARRLTECHLSFCVWMREVRIHTAYRGAWTL